MADAYPVTLCGVLMDGSTQDVDGARWGVESLEGWDSPAIETRDGDRTGRHGTYGGPRFYKARPMTLTGIVHCPDATSAFSVRRRLHTMPGTGSSGVLIRHEPDPMQVTVKFGDGPLRATMPKALVSPYVKFSLSLVAHDPFKRAVTGRTTPVASGATVAVDNDGTAAAELVVTLTTSGTVALTAGGVTLTTSSLPAGAVIDTGACTVRSSGGVDLFSSVLVAQFPALPAGGGSVSQAGTAGLSVVSHDSYA